MYIPWKKKHEINNLVDVYVALKLSLLNYN
jgi:hypothetical protein